MLLRVIALLAVFASGCVVGSPPGFSEGNSWQVPLIGPLESRELVVPVTINGKGPYPFAVNHDLKHSAIDQVLAGEANFLQVPAEVVLDYEGYQKPTGRAEILKIQVGNLTVEKQILYVVDPGRTVGGRIVRGTLGSDVIATSLIFDANRDTGMATIAVPGNFQAPAGAELLDYRRIVYTRQNGQLDRNLAEVNIDGEDLYLHIDLNQPTSTLSADAAKGKQSVMKNSYIIDEYGYGRRTESAVVGKQVTVEERFKADGLEFAPFKDGRYQPTDFDGELGVDFFSAYNVTMNRHKRTLLLAKRNFDLLATAEQRIARWGPRFAGCKSTACLDIVLTPVRKPGEVCAGAAAPDESGLSDEERQNIAKKEGAIDTPKTVDCDVEPPLFVQMQLKRDGEAATLTYDVTLLALDKDGQPLNAPPLRATLPAKAPLLVHSLKSPAYFKATSFAVVDLNPFVRPCDKAGQSYNCVWPDPAVRRTP